MSWKDALIDTLPKRKMVSTWDNENNLDCESGSIYDKEEKLNKCTVFVEENHNSTESNV